MQDQNTWNTFPGSEIQKEEFSNNNRINEILSQNMQSLNKQNVDKVQYKINRDTQMKFRKQL